MKQKDKILFSDFLFIIIIMLLVVASIFSYQRINRLTSDADLVNHTNLVKLNLEKMLSYIKDAQTAQQEYLLTKDSSYLVPLTGAIQKTREMSSQVDSLTRDSPEQQKRIKQLQYLVIKRYDRLIHVLSLSNDPSFIPTDFLSEGIQIMENIIEKAQEMIRLEDKLLLERTKEKDRSAFITPIYSLLFSLLAIMIVAFAYYRIRTEKQLRTKVEAREIQKLAEKNLELERSNSELESFNYIASHDLQEPLRKIQAFSQRIMEKDQSSFSEITKDYFDRIVNAASRMQSLIDALISYSRTNSSGTVFELTDLNKLLADVKTDLQDSIEEKKVIIENNKLPSVKVVPHQFVQLFSNLISNAIKYSKPGIAPHIIINAKNMAGKEIHEPEVNKSIFYWKISIEDNGIGFEQQYRNKIFELFQRLHGKEDYVGTGIGLAICNKIIRNHGGFITAFGNPDIGAIFNIYLPVKN
jgi:signal transduction histidine kinase